MAADTAHEGPRAQRTSHVAVVVTSPLKSSPLSAPLLTHNERLAPSSSWVLSFLLPLAASLLLLSLLLGSTLLLPQLQLSAYIQPATPSESHVQQVLLTDVDDSAATGDNSSAKPAPVRFFAFGDWGRNGTFNQSLIAEQMGVVGSRMAPQFVVSVGDNFLEEGLPDVNALQFEQSFTNIYTHRSLQIPWYAVLGNHDYYGNVLAQLHPALANRDPRWTCRRSMAVSLPLCSETAGNDGVVDSVDSGHAASGAGVDSVDSAGGSGVDCVDFVDLFLYDSMPLIPAYRHKAGRRVDWRGLNTGNWSRQEEAQLQELEGWLSNSQARWKVVGAHHPVFSYGKHGDQPEMVERIKPLLEKYGVDVYINGHDHNMQHIKKEESPVHYFTVGGGSKAWRGDEPPVAPGLKFFFPGQGFSALEVSKNALTVSFYGVFGELMYSTTLRK